MPCNAMQFHAMSCHAINTCGTVDVEEGPWLFNTCAGLCLHFTPLHPVLLCRCHLHHTDTSSHSGHIHPALGRRNTSGSKRMCAQTPHTRHPHDAQPYTKHALVPQVSQTLAPDVRVISLSTRLSSSSTLHTILRLRPSRASRRNFSHVTLQRPRNSPAPPPHNVAFAPIPPLENGRIVCILAREYQHTSMSCGAPSQPFNVMRLVHHEG